MFYKCSINAESAGEKAMAGTTDEPFPNSIMPLGRWLLDQTGREDAIGDLARAAKADAKFPRDGDLEAISRRLNELQAESEMHVALEDAELARLSA